MTPEQAMEASKKKAAPLIKLICGKIDEALTSGDFDGVSPLKVEIPKKLAVKNGATPVDVHRFMIDEAVESYKKPSETGSCWRVVVDETKRPVVDVPMNRVDGEAHFFSLTLTPRVPPPSAHPNH